MQSDKKFKNIEPLNINGLSGRMLRMPAPKSKKHKTLLIYGHHASIERIYGIADLLNEVGSVTVPDLPGFGGMDSFYKIGMKPTLDNYADYLASFIKLRFKNQKISIASMSYGFLIVTRMLQRYPKMCNQVDILIGFVGFSHHDDYAFSPARHRAYVGIANFFKLRPTAAFCRNVFLHPTVLRALYARTYNAKSKFENMSKEEKARTMEFEVRLWRVNDVRTHWFSLAEMLRINNCDRQVPLDLHHVWVKNDQYFKHAVVEQHLKIIFKSVKGYESKLSNHSPSIIAAKEDVEPFVPKALRALMEKEPA